MRFLCHLSRKEPQFYFSNCWSSILLSTPLVSADIITSHQEFDENFVKTIEDQTDAPVLFGKIPKEHWGLPEPARTTPEALFVRTPSGRVRRIRRGVRAGVLG